MTLESLIRSLNLKPHPEGGFYAETYRAAESVAAPPLPARYGGPRALSTAIYFLLTAQSCSVMHRLKSDEVFHFYDGDPVEMLLLPPDGGGSVHVLGTDLAAGERPQAVVPAGCWQGARVRPGGRFALLGCTVAPGFDFADFEVGERGELTDRFPGHGGLIGALTRSGA